MLIVDTHVHLDSADEARYPRAPNHLRPPPGKGTLDHLRAETAASGVSRAVIIQTGSTYLFDNRLILDTASAHPDWITGVCTLDPRSPESPDLLARYVSTGNIRGTRFGPTPGCAPIFGHEGHQRMWETAAGLGLTLLVLINIESADDLARLVDRYPDTPVVLDHCMGLKAGAEDILSVVCDMARFPGVYAKLTFVPGGSQEPYPFRDMHDYVHRIIEAYGADRCMWGSAFPCELWCVKVTYNEHLRLFTHEIPLEEGVRRAITGETAMRLWFP